MLQSASSKILMEFTVRTTGNLISLFQDPVVLHFVYRIFLPVEVELYYPLAPG